MSEQSTELQAAQLSSASAKHAAWIAAVTSMIAALASVASIVWSTQRSAEASDRAAKLAAEAAVKSVSVQILGESDKSRAEFLRAQRQALYGKIAAHEQEVHEAEVAYVQVLLDSPDRRELDRSLNAQGARLGRARAALMRDRFQVEILGSRAFRDAYDEIVKEHSQQMGTMAEIASRYREVGPQPGQGVPYWKQESKLLTIREKMMSAARVDMGNG